MTDGTPRGALLRQCERLRELAAVNQASSVAQAVSGLAEKLQESRFYLAVVGQFKRGKTSFLNALLRQPILPVAVLPLTSIVTVLRYGPDLYAEVVYQSGGRRRIAIDELAGFVTEKHNPGNAKQVHYVEVFCPSDILATGAALVDTPGIGSVYTHNTAVTFDFLPKIDAAILLTSPDPPLTEVELQFASRLASQVQRIFVVLNKIDLLDRDGLEEVLEFARASLGSLPGANGGTIYPVSSKRALEARLAGSQQRFEQSGFPAVEGDLVRFLRNEQETVLVGSAVRNMRQLLADLRFQVELHVHAAGLPLAELQSRLDALGGELERARDDRDDNATLLDRAVGRLTQEVEVEARQFAASERDRVLAGVADRFRNSPARSGKSLVKEMDRALGELVEQTFDRWRRGFERDAADRLRQATARFAKRVNELMDAVRGSAADLFGLEVQPMEASERLVEFEPCGYFVEPLTIWGLGNAPFLLPGPLFRRYILAGLRRRVPLELERNATRVAFDLKQRLAKSASLFREAMNRRLDETMSGIEEAIRLVIEQRQMGIRNHAEVAQRAEAALRELSRLDSELAAINSDSPAPVEV